MSPEEYLARLEAGEEITEIIIYNQHRTDADLEPLLIFLNNPLNSAAAQRLTHLNLGCNKLTHINLSAFSSLVELELRYNNFEAVAVTDKQFLVYLGLDACSKLINIVLQNLPALERLNISGTIRPYLDVSHLPSLNAINRFGTCSRVDRMASRDARAIAGYRPKFPWGGFVGGTGITENDLIPPVFTAQILDGHFTPFFEGHYYKSLVKFNLDKGVMHYEYPLILSPNELNAYSKNIALVLEKMPKEIAIKVGEFLTGAPYKKLARESMTFLKNIYGMQVEAEQPNSQLAILTKYENGKFNHLEKTGENLLNSYVNVLAIKSEAVKSEAVKSRCKKITELLYSHLPAAGVIGLAGVAVMQAYTRKYTNS